VARAEPSLEYGTRVAWGVIVATVLGSGIAFLDSTIVNVALPAIERDLGGGLAGLQWTIDAYLLTLGAFLLLGGSLGDLYGRRRLFIYGLISFSVASGLCGFAPSIGGLIAARALQGLGAAMLVPGSLAIIQASFRAEDRSRAIGAWSGLAGVTTAIGPFAGGYLVDSVSWRYVFFINIPLAIVAIYMAVRFIPESKDEEMEQSPDVPGAVAAALALGGSIYALIEGRSQGWTSPSIVASICIGAAALIAFFWIEERSKHPMLPLDIFRSRQFSGANGTTLVVYGALTGAFVLIVVELQNFLGYSALEAGASLLPVTILLLLLSARAGKLAQNIGPRIPMTLGPLLAGVGLLLLVRIEPGATYISGVFPGVLVFGLGMALTVAPLTAAVLAAVESRHAGVASGVNNAVARTAGLLMVALLPLVAALPGVDAGSESFTAGFHRALIICAVLCVLGAVNSWLTIRTLAPTTEAAA
jgi:EmrB/QacA subfamily drug resistance transporter